MFLSSEEKYLVYNVIFFFSWAWLLGTIIVVLIYHWYTLTPFHWPYLTIVHITFCNIKPTLICSVGKAPIPTRVVYAFTTPYTSPTCWGGTPSPVHTPPTVQFDEVTKGYVPARKTKHNPVSAMIRHKDWLSFMSQKEIFTWVLVLKLNWNSSQRVRHIILLHVPISLRELILLVFPKMLPPAANNVFRFLKFQRNPQNTGLSH